MALVERNGRPYLYRTIRRGGRVTSEYRGSGETAALIALLDEEEWREKAETRRAEAADREALAELDGILDELCRQARGLAADALRSAGYHQHARGDWRKRRVDGPRTGQAH